MRQERGRQGEWKGHWLIEMLMTVQPSWDHSTFVFVNFTEDQRGLLVQLPSDRELHLSSSGCITDGQGRGSWGYFQGSDINKWILADKEIFLILFNCCTWYSLAWICYGWFSHFLIDGHLGSLQVSAIVILLMFLKIWEWLPIFCYLKCFNMCL